MLEFQGRTYVHSESEDYTIMKRYKYAKIRNGIIYIHVLLHGRRYRISTKLDATPPNLEYVEANWHKFLKLNDTIMPKESHIKKGEDLKDSPKNLFRDFAFESLKAGENGRRAITHKIYIQILQRDILPYFGDMDIAEITSFKVKSWQNELLKKIKPQSLNNVRGVFHKWSLHYFISKYRP
ncbi:hypothetical protein BKH42_00910 [Helicobacter sp. 13S00482-2]|uniref:hypothetical protein n=1 Tax=Helicobacter sp. 13S00482-2 TaxID=1476200 RepID=UPI000BA606B4|nr:hypothetical protein [Helicobacter sp. 13S00482-2]PAF54501.1 hypothetical protein BKH42_00910 [Helicobacter sp. 13S00482-2]